MLQAFGVGPHTAATLLVTVGGQPRAPGQRTVLKAYIDRRTKEGRQTKFIMRCLKRHVAREIFKLLPCQELALTT